MRANSSRVLSRAWASTRYTTNLNYASWFHNDDAADTHGPTARFTSASFKEGDRTVLASRIGLTARSTKAIG